MILNLKSVFHAAVRATAVLIVVDYIFERGVAAVWGISAKAALPQVSFDGWFLFVNYLFLFLEMILTMGVYGIIQPRFNSKTKAAGVTCAVFLIYTLLFSSHFANFGLFPLPLYLMFVFSCFIELPLAIFVGAHYYRD